ncbi:hypothetical protein L228DRAFT_285177 [Xylona heveae TC161]|uniref:Uncharacterized protein n=1 Tax=Xylona heveae (strain CBS 132557 / TC161) TaxID=1328760 RepID=A0A165AHC7_XYLHT|nr:hypothetical protein L228DRAFT_285177 [Xylona heveae TC161]KZF20475.1 hypothetical protein L228DRAFT_285177 [Xylona heveae TC161]
MAEIMGLHDEAWRIVQAPYICSLKRLHDSLCVTFDIYISRWAKYNPCLVESLVSDVSECLWTSPYALNILVHLSKSLPARDAFLRRNPGLLDLLSKKSLECQGDDDKHGRACIALLRFPLPREVPLPGSLLPFFKGTFDRAALSPSAETIRPVYVLLSGNCSDLLEIIPVQMMARFQDQLVNILKTLEDHAVCLLCLGILAAIAHPESHASNLTTGTPKESDGSFTSERVPFSEGLKQFFTARKAPKTLEFISLQVAYACSETNSLSQNEATEYFELAKVIAGAISIEVKQDFVNGNSRGARKLLEKCLHPSNRHIDFQVRALDFVLDGLHARIVNVPSLNSHGQTLVKSLLAAMDSVGSESLANSAKELLLYMDESNIFLLLETILDISVSCEEPNFKEFHRIDISMVLLEALNEALSESSTLRRAVLRAMSGKLSGKLTSLHSPKSSQKSQRKCCACGVCCQKYFANKGKLRRSLRALFIKTAFCGHEYEIYLSKTSIGALIDQQDADHSILQADFTESTICANIRSYDLFGTPAQKDTRQISSNNWRETLSENLLANARLQYESIVQQMGTVCRELEERCDEAETPFRQEKFKVEELELRLLEAEDRNKELDSMLLERNLFQVGAEAELSALRKQAESAEKRLGDYVQQTGDLKELLKSVELKAIDTETHLKEGAQKRELETAAMISAKDDAAEDLMKELCSMMEKLNERKKENSMLVEEKQKITEDKNWLEGALADVESKLKLRDASLREEHSQLIQLQGLYEKLKGDLECTFKKVEELESANTHLLDEQNLAKQALQGELDLDSLTDGSHNGATISTLVAQYAEKIRGVERHARSELEKANLKHLELEEKFEIQSRQFNEKCKEFSELREWKERLMVAMYPKDFGSSGFDARGESFDADHTEERIAKRSRTQKMPLTPNGNPPQALAGRGTGLKPTNGLRQPLRDIGSGEGTSPSDAREKRHSDQSIGLSANWAGAKPPRLGPISYGKQCQTVLTTAGYDGANEPTQHFPHSSCGRSNSPEEPCESRRYIEEKENIEDGNRRGELDCRSFSEISERQSPPMSSENVEYIAGYQGTIS